jgi:hypothetical protein
MPLLTLPREMIAKILMALTPDYAALCCTAQTCVVLRDMETTDKKVLWKHMCDTLIVAQLQQEAVDPNDPYDPFIIFLVILERQARLEIDSKKALRLNHAHRMRLRRSNHALDLCLKGPPRREAFLRADRRLRRQADEVNVSDVSDVSDDSDDDCEQIVNDIYEAAAISAVRDFYNSDNFFDNLTLKRCPGPSIDEWSSACVSS